MPLFHANSLMSGWPQLWWRGLHSPGPPLQRIPIPSRCAALRGHVVQLHGQGSGLPVDHARASRRCRQHLEDRLRQRRSPHVVEAAAKRFGITIVDVFGSTEGAIALDRSGDPPAAPSDVCARESLSSTPTRRRSRGRALTGEGRLVNPEECVGEIVNTLGVGPFEGITATRKPCGARRATAGTGVATLATWTKRVGVLRRPHVRLAASRRRELPGGPDRGHRGSPPDVMMASVYGVPDADSGDQVMVALVLRQGATFDGRSFAAWLDGQSDLSPSGGHASCATATRFPLPRPTRSSPARSS